MKAIWKYNLDAMNDLTLNMQAGARIVSLQVQQGAICLWAEVDPDAEKEQRYFRLFGTGHSIAGMEKLHYLGTVQLERELIVVHVYEYKP